MSDTIAIPEAASNAESKNEEVKIDTPNLTPETDIPPKVEETPSAAADIPQNVEEKKIETPNAAEFERVQNENAKLRIKMKSLLQDLQARTEEKENYKNKVLLLEKEVTDLKNQQPNTLTPAQQNAVQSIKKQSEEILTKAKGVIFDKTKLIKQQELQIETLHLQITSLKEVLDITKELLNIRNLEVKELQDKMEILDQKFSVERLRHDIITNKMDAVTKMNTDLKEEYQTQLSLFTELRDQYAKREELRNFQDENKPEQSKPETEQKQTE